MKIPNRVGFGFRRDFKDYMILDSDNTLFIKIDGDYMQIGKKNLLLFLRRMQMLIDHVKEYNPNLKI